MTTGNRVFDALRSTTPDIGAVARSLLGVLAIAALAQVADSGAAAVWAAAAGAICGAIAMRDSPGGRVQLVVIVSLQLGAAVFLGSLTSSHTVVFIVVVALWCFAAGMQWALGSNAGLVAAAAAALLAIAAPDPPTMSGVVVPTVLTIAAGCLQAALIAVWPPQRWRAQRNALTWAYRSLATDARRLAADRETPLDEAQLAWLRDAFADTLASRRLKAYHGGYRLPERTLAALVALRGELPAERDGVAPVLNDAAVALDAIATHKHTSRKEAELALTRVDTAVTAMTGPEAAAAQRFSRQLREDAEFRFADMRQTDLISSIRAAATAVRGHLTSTSPILRHAVRLSAATALGIAADRFAPIAHGYWIVLTVLMVLRPETAHTYTRCVGRLGGVAAGIVAASLINMLWQPTGSTAAMMAVVFLAITYAVVRFGYIAASATLSVAVVFLLDINTAAVGATMEDRLFSVVIGGGLAVVAHVVLPDHALTRLRQRAGELLKTEIDYAATVIKAFVHEVNHPADTLSTAWQRAYRARAGFEVASSTVRLDSPELRRWLRSYRTALNTVTSACTSLESSLPAQSPAALTPEFVAAVDEYVDALRGEPPNPATPWTVDVSALTAADLKVRELAALPPQAGGQPHVQEGASPLGADNGAARVLVDEVGTITRSLTAIAPTGEPTSAG